PEAGTVNGTTPPLAAVVNQPVPEIAPGAETNRRGRNGEGDTRRQGEKRTPEPPEGGTTNSTRPPLAVRDRWEVSRGVEADGQVTRPALPPLAATDSGDVSGDFEPGGQTTPPPLPPLAKGGRMRVAILSFLFN